MRNLKKLLLCLLIALFYYSILLAQPAIDWIRFYDNGQTDVFLDIYSTTNGDFALTGFTKQGDNYYLSNWVMLINAFGDEIWQSSISADGMSLYGESIIETQGGDFVIAGRSSLNSSGAYVWKISNDGNIIWQRELRERLNATSVIELKDQTYVICGYTKFLQTPRRGFVMHLSVDGEELWYVELGDNNQFSYILRALREVPDIGIISTGNNESNQENIHPAIYTVLLDFEGNIVWTRQLRNLHFNHSYSKGIVSSENGYILGGAATDRQSPNGLMIQNIDIEGNWGFYEFTSADLSNRFFGEAICKLNNNGGFVVVGELQQYGDNGMVMSPVSAKFSADGQLQWKRVYPINRLLGEFGSINRFHSVVQGQDGAVMAVGRAYHLDERVNDGLIIRIEPEQLYPIVFHFSPDTLQTVLASDSIQFELRARDQWGQELSYQWFRSEDDLNRNNSDTTVTIVFPALGRETIKCIVSNDEYSSEIRWHVNVVDLMIDTHTPDTLNLVIKRNTSVDFSVEPRYLEGDPINYEWMLQRMPNGNREYVSEEQTYEHTFSVANDFQMTGRAWRGEREDTRRWNISVRSAIYSAIPESSELSIERNNELSFEIIPFDENSDSLVYLWTVSGEEFSTEPHFDHFFADTGQFTVWGYLWDGADADSQMWTVNVLNPESVNDFGSELPSDFALHALHPNPFNSSTQIRFDLPTASEVKLSVFDINGRLLTNLVNGNVSAGSHSVTWDASGFATGIYFVTMELGVGRGRPTPHSKGETSRNNASNDGYYKQNNGYYKQLVQKAVLVR